MTGSSSRTEDVSELFEWPAKFEGSESNSSSKSAGTVRSPSGRVVGAGNSLNGKGDPGGVSEERGTCSKQALSLANGDFPEWLKLPWSGTKQSGLPW